jgi:hypothetical protein
MERGRPKEGGRKQSTEETESRAKADWDGEREEEEEKGREEEEDNKANPQGGRPGMCNTLGIILNHFIIM